MPRDPSVHSHVILSLEDGIVWASWSGTHAKVELGRCDNVIEMMSDFVKQCEVAERLFGEARLWGSCHAKHPLRRSH